MIGSLHIPLVSESPPTDPTSEFLEHMHKSRRAIRNYLFSLHPHDQDIDDLIQQTSLTLWREFERYDRSREFLPWALRISYFEVLRLRKQHSRDRLVFSENLLEMLAEDVQPEAATRPEGVALAYCLNKLDADARELLMACYSKGSTVAEIAQRRNIHPHRLYRQLERARRAVIICVRRQLHLDGDAMPS